MDSKHPENSSKRMVVRTRKPRGEKRHRVPPRKNYPTKPRNLDKREKLKITRCRTSEFAPLRWTNAYGFSDGAHGEHMFYEHLDELDDRCGPPEDTHIISYSNNVKKPYYGIISICDGIEEF